MRSLAWKRKYSHTVDVPGNSGSCCAYLQCDESVERMMTQVHVREHASETQPIKELRYMFPQSL